MEIIIFKKDPTVNTKNDIIFDDETKSYKIWNGKEWLGENTEEFITGWKDLIERERKPTFFEKRC